MIFSFAANLNSTCTMYLSSSTFNMENSKYFNSPTGGRVSVFHLMLRSSKLYSAISVASSKGLREPCRHPEDLRYPRRQPARHQAARLDVGFCPTRPLYSAGSSFPRGPGGSSIRRPEDDHKEPQCPIRNEARIPNRLSSPPRKRGSRDRVQNPAAPGFPLSRVVTSFARKGLI